MPTVSRATTPLYGKANGYGGRRAYESTAEGRAVLTTSTIALAYAAALMVGLPLLAFRAGLRDEHAADVAAARSAIYLSAALSTGILAAVTLGVAAWQDLPAAALGWRVDLAGPSFVWAIATAVAGLIVVWLVVRIGQALGLPESRISFHLMPRTGGEQRAFLVVAAVAAIGEEYLYRGYMYRVLAEVLGGPWPAVVLTSISFGVAHGYQRTIGMIRAGILGLLLAMPVLWTGSLFPSIVAHFWINAAVGLGGWKRLFPVEAAAMSTDSERGFSKDGG